MCQLMLLMVLIAFSFSSCMLLGLFWYIHSLWKTHKTEQEMLDAGITSHSSSISTVNLAVWHCAFMLTPWKLAIQDIQVCYMWKTHNSFITYVHPPHVLAWLPPDGFSCNLIFVTFMEICQENPKLVKTGQKCWALDIHTCFTVGSNTQHSYAKGMHCCISLTTLYIQFVPHAEHRYGSIRKNNWSVLFLIEAHGVLCETPN